MREQILSFAEEAFFTRDKKYVGFEALLPKLYGRDTDSSEKHRLLYENGEPAALCCLQTDEASVCGDKIKVGGIGTVCVSPEKRGRGYLGLLMEDALRELKKCGCHIAVLDGQRQRYARFGFAHTGQRYIFEVRPRNVRGVSPDGVRIVPLEKGGEYEKYARELFESQPVYTVRGDEFFGRLETWHMKPRAVMKNGAFAGYFTLSQGEVPEIHELFMKDGSVLFPLLAAAAEKIGGSFRVSLFPWQRDILKNISLIAERCALTHDGGFRILNWQKAAAAGLRLKEPRLCMKDAFTLEIKGESRLTFYEEKGEIKVRESCEKACLTLDTESAGRLMFGPDGEYVTGSEKAPAGLFPLYLGYFDGDKI